MSASEQQPPRTVPRRILDFFGLKRSIVGLLGMVILVGMGPNFAEQFLPKYLLALTTNVKDAILFIGILYALTNLLGALYSYPGGYLSERIGTKHALLIFNVMTMVGYSLVILVPTWWALIIGAFFFVSWNAISLPATMGLVSKVLPRNKRTMGVTMHSLVRRIPMALGPLAGGALIVTVAVTRGHGTEPTTQDVIDAVRMLFIGALIVTFIGIIFQQRVIEPDKPRAGDASAPKAEKSPLRLFRRMSPNLRNLLVSDILIRFCEQIPYGFVVVWATGWLVNDIYAHRFVNELQYGSLRVVEMITAIAVYIPIAYLADRTMKKPWVLITFCFFTFFPLLLLFSTTYELLILAFVLRGLKEFGEPTRKALIMDLAPEDAKAGMFGLYYLMRDSIVSIAAFGGALLWRYWSPEANLLAAFTFGVLGTIWFAIRGRDLTSGAAHASA
jgi:MFS family permease